MKENIEKTILPFINDTESKILSYIALNGDISKVSTKTLRVLEYKGLLISNDKEKHKDDSKFSIAPIARKVISTYPLFGEYTKSEECIKFREYTKLGEYIKTKAYTRDFFPMLLSAIANGYLSSKQSQWIRYLSSDFFTSFFPAKDKKLCTESAIHAVKSLLKLEIAKEGSSRLILDKERAISFYSLNEETRLSYILAPDVNSDERKRLSMAINLAFRLRNIKTDQIDEYIKLIEGITGFDLTNFLELLIEFEVLYIDNNRYNGTERKLENNDKGTLSSDFIYSTTSETDIPLFLFLSPVKSDIISQWAIEKTAMRNAFSMGYSNDDIKLLLESLTSFPVPDSISSRIDSWYGAFLSLRARRALILVADERNSKLLDTLPLLKIHIVEKVSNNVFLMNPDTEAEWRNILTYTGFDMLGVTEGPSFQEDKIQIPLVNTDSMPILPIEREIPYDSERQKKLFGATENIIEKSFIKAGFAFDESTHPEINMVEGLFFQEKLHEITKAISTKSTLYTEYADGKIEFVHPLDIKKENDESIVITEEGERQIDKLWKIAILPFFIE